MGYIWCVCTVFIFEVLLDNSRPFFIRSGPVKWSRSLAHSLTHSDAAAAVITQADAPKQNDLEQSRRSGPAPFMAFAIDDQRPVTDAAGYTSGLEFMSQIYAATEELSSERHF